MIFDESFNLITTYANQIKSSFTSKFFISDRSMQTYYLYNVKSFAFSNTDGNEIMLGKMSYYSPSLDYLECLNYTTITLNVIRTENFNSLSLNPSKS